MVINKDVLSQMFICAASLLKDKSGYLSEIDSKFGDGDHGVTINKIANLIDEKVSQWENESISEFIEDLGDSIMAVNGGSAGPLYGTMIGGMAVPLNDETEIDCNMLKEMLKSMVSEMEDITTAKVGDKTMMDALIPAVEKAQSGRDVKEVMELAALGASEGAKASENFVSKFGRARSYKEQTIGTPDAGAVSTSVLFEGLSKGIK